MKKSSVHDMTAVEISAGYRAKLLSPVEVARHFLDRIDKLDKKVNSYCLVDVERTLAEASASEARYLKGEPLSELDGVPVAIKDLLLTRGWPTLRGSKLVDPKGPWEEDAPSVARLRDAGAVLLGKTTTPEFGWKGTNDSPLTGSTRNPWNTDKTPGGSSGGSAAAVAARLAPLALGSDGGGSIRIPAGLTGTFGLKPQFGRVAAYPLATSLAAMAHVGPMSRTVADSCLLMNTIAKPDSRDWQSLPGQANDYMLALQGSMKGKRIAFSATLGWVSRIDEEVLRLATAAALRFEELGATVEFVDPQAGNPTNTWWTIWASGLYHVLRAATEEQLSLLEPGLRNLFEAGREITIANLQDALIARGEFASKMRVFTDRFDLLMTPSLATTAFDANLLSPTEDGVVWSDWTPYTATFNLTQQPAASVPCGYASSGLPVGLQVVGRPYDEIGVLTACHAYERLDPHYDKTPQGF